MSHKFMGAVIGAAFGVMMMAGAAWGHHSFAAAFDADKPVTIKGVITEARLANPHSWIYLDVTTDKGKIEKWGFEGQTPTALIRSGVKPEVFKVGSVVTIKGYHARDLTKNEAAAREIILADGRSFIIGPKGNEPDADR